MSVSPFTNHPAFEVVAFILTFLSQDFTSRSLYLRKGKTTVSSILHDLNSLPTNTLSRDSHLQAL